MEKSSLLKKTITRPGTRFGIFRRVFITAILITILPIIIIGIYTSNTINQIGTEISERTTNILNRKTIDILEMQAVETADNVERFLHRIESDLEVIAGYPVSAEMYLDFALKKVSGIWEKGYPENNQPLALYKEIAYIDASGKEKLKIKNGKIVKKDRLKNISDPSQTTYLVEDYFAKTRNTPAGEIYVSRLSGFFINKEQQLNDSENLDETSGSVFYDGVIRFCKPLFKDSIFTGMVMLALDQRHLMEFTQHILPLSKEKVIFPSYKSGNYAFLFDDQGWIITHPKLWDIRGVDRAGKWIPAYTPKSTPEQIDKGLIPFNLDSAGFIHKNYPIVARQVREKQTGTLITTNVGGISKMMAYAPVNYDKGEYSETGVFGGVTVGAEIIGFHVPAEFVKREISKAIDIVRENLYWVLLFSVLISAITGWLLSVEFARPIIKITKGANEIAQGSLDKRIEIKRKDEIGNLAHTFNLMADELQKSQSNLLQTINELKTSSTKTQSYALELEYQIKILESIQRISNIIGTTFNMNTVIRLILEDCVKSIGFDRAILYLIDDQQKYMSCSETYGFKEENEKYARSSKYNLERFNCIETRVVKEARIIFVEDFETYPEASDLDRKIRKYTKSNSFVYVPLRVKEKIIGILGADKIRSKKPITGIDINSLQILANQASRVIENTRLYSEIIRQRNFVEDIFNYMINGVITIDGNGNITSFNQSAKSILDIKQKVPFHQNRLGVFTSNTNTIKEIREQLLKNGQYSGYNIKVKNNGQEKYLNINASLVMRNGDTPDSIIIIEDVSQKKQLDDQIQHLEKLASIGRFAASIAHEIRNPLTGISLFLDDLHDRTSGQPELSRLFEKALSEIERLEKLTHEILVYSHPSSGEYTLNDINYKIKNILQFLKPQYNNNNIEVSLELDEDISPFYFNADRMRQALLNILLNAIQAMPDGGSLSVKTERAKTNPDLIRRNRSNNISSWIKIEISDTGSGIALSERDKIFEPFYSSKKQGSGLGLSTTYNIISEHNGTIHVASEIGQGAVFTVYLPFTEQYAIIKSKQEI